MILDVSRLEPIYGKEAPWFAENIPLFECPDRDIEEIYYFRWGVYRKHIKNTPCGFIISEFLPDVPWASKYNAIVCPAGHHFLEGRWLWTKKYLDDYAIYWFSKDGSPRSYSVWLAEALLQRARVTGDLDLPVALLPDLVQNYYEWEKTNLYPSGLFWSNDNSDGGEISISGDGFRPTLNSYMAADARAIAFLGQKVGNTRIVEEFTQKSETLKRLLCERLWDPQAQFFKCFPLSEGSSRDNAHLLSESLRGRKIQDWSFHKVDPDHNVRELHGYLPYLFNLPGPGYEACWNQLMDPNGFYGTFGPTTAERRHPRFMFEDSHMCLWNGPSWPFLTSLTLVALGNLLNNYQQSIMSKKDFFRLMRIYARSQHLALPDGTIIPCIDENLHPDTGVWLAREILHRANSPDKDRGKDYNHSTFCDLVLTGLAGLRPRYDDVIEINPLVPEGDWDYFAADNIPYHGHRLTIFYDKNGTRYGKGQGLHLMVNGQERPLTKEKSYTCRI